MEYTLTFVCLTVQQILIKKLSFYAINTRHIKWMQYWLTCQQRSCQRGVTVGEYFFRGLLQGSVTGLNAIVYFH